MLRLPLLRLSFLFLPTEVAPPPVRSLGEGSVPATCFPVREVTAKEDIDRGHKGLVCLTLP